MWNIWVILYLEVDLFLASCATEQVKGAPAPTPYPGHFIHGLNLALRTTHLSQRRRTWMLKGVGVKQRGRERGRDLEMLLSCLMGNVGFTAFGA